MRVIKKEEAALSLDGPEVCREYCRIDQLWFGTSTLLPGQTGGIDPGHPVSKEVFFASRGTVLVRNPANNKCYQLNQEDLLVIDEGEPHEITNIGETPAVIAWFGAPNA
jgi:mannose-6-phosphate isomerase-like protein (cupin superfamily)